MFKRPLFYNLLVLQLILTFLAGCEVDDFPDDHNFLVIPVKVDVRIKVGDFLYEDLDATIVVRGYSTDNSLQWSREYDYNKQTKSIINVPGSYDYYRISMSKWNVHDEQTFTVHQLYADRANGPSPTTHVFGGQVAAKKLKSVTRSYQHADASQFSPSSREEFEYTGGRLAKIKAADYTVASGTWTPSRYYTLLFENNLVKKMHGFQAADDQLFLETEYEYGSGLRLSRITQKNTTSGVTGVVNFTYYTGKSDSISTYYSHSVGQSFSYHFSYRGKNIVNDKTLRGGQLCNTGSYTYDKNINPMRHLGYTDFLLTNMSVNNKTGEDRNHTGCYFPDETIVNLQYQYDGAGYPLTMTMTLSGGTKVLEEYLYYP